MRGVVGALTILGPSRGIPLLRRGNQHLLLIYVSRSIFVDGWL